MSKYDVIVVGAGPAGIFACYEITLKAPHLKVLLVDKGHDIYRRRCPILEEKIKLCPPAGSRKEFAGCVPLDRLRRASAATARALRVASPKPARRPDYFIELLISCPTFPSLLFQLTPASSKRTFLEYICHSLPGGVTALFISGIYRRRIGSNLFVRMVLIFSVIAIITIVTLSYFTFYFMSQSIIRGELEDQKNTMQRVSAYINDKFESVQTLVHNIYRDQMLADNVAYLLENSYQDYVEHRLNQFYNSENAVPIRGLNYFDNRMEDDADIANILLYSSDKQFLLANKGRTMSKLIDANAAKSYIPDAMALQTAGVTVPNEWVRRAIGQSDPRLFSVRETLTDMATLKNIGQLVVYFRSDSIWNAISSDKDGQKGQILVLTGDGQVIFDSSGKYYGGIYPYMDRIDTLSGTGMLEEASYITTLAPNQEGYVVVGITPKKEMAASYGGLKRLIISISGVCILVAIVIPSLFVVNYAKRTSRIIRTMRKVENGDTTVRIPETKDDELGQISRSFNEMLEELTRYIDRVYKAEIQQKHTELAALQARVNPHFLYNTLEVIRMRAISQGAADVSEMIYSLAVLFRSFVQQRTFVKLGEELENCKRYLELFRIRYQDKFSYAIESDPQLADLKIMKMSLQPIVENYIIHGMSEDRADNRIVIRTKREEGAIRIEIADNGIGIEPDKLEEIRRLLADAHSGEEERSFGLRSVDERLKLMYGNEYGIGIDSEAGSGTIISLWLPEAEGGMAGNVPGIDR